MKTFDVPIIYRSQLIGAIKEKRKANDKLKKDFSPTCLDFGPVQIFLARHFGFCYGVENAIEVSFRAVEQNPGKRIFLLSEIIHNPQVNADLMKQGVSFIMDTLGKQIIDWDQLTADDVVIIPAFGTTLENEKKLKERGITPTTYDATCPFVERVWNKAEQIGKQDYSVVVHGKPKHEETRATFSHSNSFTPTVIVNDLAEAKKLARYITGEEAAENFSKEFAGQFSENFDPTLHLQRIGVVNQTTMLASDTKEIAAYLKSVMMEHYQLTEQNVEERFADTRDTLCYATNDNQSAVRGLLSTEADFAILVGGYNSSNTSHLVELCEEKLVTYYISSEDEIISNDEIHHWNFHKKVKEISHNFLPKKHPIKILMSSGASCPDAVVENVIRKITSMLPGCKTMDQILLSLHD